MKILNANPPVPAVPSDVMIPVIAAKSKLWLKQPTDQIDTWLDAQGFYRKHIARDASSLFRCVSEQIFLTQVHHLTVRKHCIQFALNQPEVFKQLTDISVKDYVDRLYNQREWGNTLDMEIISLIYQVDFAMYKEIKKPIEKVTSNGYCNFIMLSLSYEHHYDSVYPKQHIVNAAICQSILYEMLYKNVFKLEEVDYAVNKMLHDKNARYQTELNAAFFTTGFQMRFEMRDTCKNVKELLNFGITPFPYKVAKSLDPNIYRNVEFDTWNEQKKGTRHGCIIWNNRELQEGSKCLVNFKGENETIKRSGYIQKMSPNKGPVEVFIQDLGEKLTVPYESLEVFPSSSSRSSHNDSLMDMFGNLSCKGNPQANIESDENEPRYSTIEEDMEHARKMEEYQPNSVTSNVHYVHSTPSTVPTTCYACISSHGFPQETDNKPIIHNSAMEEHHKYNLNSQNGNEMPNPTNQSLPVMQYPASLYPVMSQDIEIQPAIYSNNMLPPKTVSNVNETNDMGNPVRVFYNNNVDYYRYGLPTVPYYVLSPNYVVPWNAESQGSSNTDVQRIQFTPPTNQQQNELIYTVPLSNMPNTKTDISMFPTMIPYPAVPPAKKPLPRNNGSADVNFIESQSYRSHKEMIYVKDPPPMNPPPPVVPQPNAVQTNIFPCYNNSYTSISPPLYYHPYDYSGPCYPPCPELPSYADNTSPTTYQMPHIVPLPYPDEMYQSNGQFICQPMLQASYN